VGDRRLTLAGCALALMLAAGCGPTPPQAPGPQAHQLNESLSAMSTACGHAAEIQEFSNDRRDLTIAEHQAQKQIPVLVKVYEQNPDWIFQGKSVEELVQMSHELLDECGLHAAARKLRQQASRARHKDDG
jgi:hypothetical protein